MAIYTKQGNTKIRGKVGDVLTDLTCIVITLRDGGIPKKFITEAIEEAFDYEEENSIEFEGKKIMDIIDEILS